MLLQPVMAGLPRGPQTDKEKKQNKQTKQNKAKYMHKRCTEKQWHNTEQKWKDCNYVLYNIHSSTIKVTTLCMHSWVS